MSEASVIKYPYGGQFFKKRKNHFLSTLLMKKKKKKTKKKKTAKTRPFHLRPPKVMHRILSISNEDNPNFKG
jgi:hypothetical protein